MSDDIHRAWYGVAFMLAGAISISINDMLVKALSGGYPLHQIVFIRSVIGVTLSLGLVMAEGGFGLLRVSRPALHVFRALLIVLSNLTFFAALAALPLADATALFFVSPLLITLLAVPILGERIGAVRIAAICVGFLGVIIMLRPWGESSMLQADRLILLLPVCAAFTYALAQVLTRLLGRDAKASVLSINVQSLFIVVSLGFFVITGDGRFAEGSENASVSFLLRAWVWPPMSDSLVFAGLGMNAALLGYCLSQAYRLADAAVVAPYEYIAMPMAVIWGFAIFGDMPDWEVWFGMALVAGSGLLVFLRMR